jgi:hypothetical protein
MQSLFKHVRLLLIAATALALSAGLAFGATPPAASTGLANAAAHAGKTVPTEAGDETLAADDEDLAGDEEADEAEDVDESEVEEAEDVEVEGAEDAGEHCATDPSALTPEDLEAMNHGSIVCWAAQQTEWPEWFSNHGAFVRCWAHQGKADAASCTEDPNATEGTVEEPTGDELSGDELSGDELGATRGKGHLKSHGKGLGKGKAKHLD